MFSVQNKTCKLEKKQMVRGMSAGDQKIGPYNVDVKAIHILRARFHENKDWRRTEINPGHGGSRHNLEGTL